MSSSSVAATATTARGGLQEDAGSGIPILSRLNRLDHILKHLDDIKTRETQSPRSTCSYASTNSTANTNFSGDISTPILSPDPEKQLSHCRPVDQVLMEVQQKGTLIQRLIHVEDRVFKLCLQMEEELEGETRSRELQATSKDEENRRKGGLKKLIKSCVKGGGGRRKKPNLN